jgi:hypothetical protein
MRARLEIARREKNFPPIPDRVCRLRAEEKTSSDEDDRRVTR